MADIRELIILSPGLLDPKPETPLARFLLNRKMDLRRAVVRSSRIPVLRVFYLAMYKAHLRFAGMLGRRFAGTDAVYVTSGMATGEVHIGVTDIDLAFYGSWPEERQFRLMKVVGLCTLLSPLFDKRSLASIGTVEDVKHLSATDMTYALVHAKGREQWKLLHGRNVLEELPLIAPERFAGCVYMDVRRWWSTLATVVFGDDIIARDRIFQNTICFKVAAEMLRSERMLSLGVIDGTPRSVLVREASLAGEPVHQLLDASAADQFLTIAEDPRPVTLHWFLERSEMFHRAMQALPVFASIKSVTVAGTADELVLAPQTSAQAEALVGIVTQKTEKLRAAYLVPAAVMFSPDSLSLVLEFEGSEAPAADLLHEVSQAHRAVKLPQRMALYVLLREAAYQLDAGAALEFFYFMLTPQTNPDVFAAFHQRGYLLSGEPRTYADDLRWSPVAQELMLEELEARRGAHRRFGCLSRATPLENLRNLFRLLQLLVMEQTAAEGEIVLPTTIASVCRLCSERNPGVAADLQTLQALHRSALEEGHPVPQSADQLMVRICDTVIPANIG